MSVASKVEIENILLTGEENFDGTVKKYNIYREFIPVVSGILKIYAEIKNKNDLEKLQKIKKDFLDILDYTINSPLDEINGYLEKENELNQNIIQRIEMIYDFIIETDKEITEFTMDSDKLKDYKTNLPQNIKDITKKGYDTENIIKSVKKNLLEGLTYIEEFTIIHMQREIEIYYRDEKSVDLFEEFKSIKSFNDLYGDLGKKNKNDALTKIAKNTIEIPVTAIIEYLKYIEKTNILNIKKINKLKEKTGVILERTLEMTGLGNYISKSLEDEIKYI